MRVLASKGHDCLYEPRGEPCPGPAGCTTAGAEVNAAADALGRPRVDILNAEEALRITELIEAGTMPQKWDGTEPTADEPFEEIAADGSVQQLLFGALDADEDLAEVPDEDPQGQPKESPSVASEEP